MTVYEQKSEVPSSPPPNFLLATIMMDVVAPRLFGHIILTAKVSLCLFRRSRFIFKKIYAHYYVVLIVTQSLEQLNCCLCGVDNHHILT